MRSPTKQDNNQARATRRTTDRASGTTRTAHRTTVGEREADAGGTPKGSVVTSMVDALEDILKWERASERAMRVATEQSTTELDPSN
ncbi:MAG: hypothetical protein JWO86_8528 [Myxococcaceae bacterium]|jgi:hypothetical protein|nr:hypothetical protein [Myxococcaceae bacterium]MEA2750043.1 hypothetical protein [Myxococcales bacterium]